MVFLTSAQVYALESSGVKWVLVETNVNPNERPLGTIVGGVHKNMTVSENSFTSRTTDTRQGTLLGDVSWEATFDSPPEELIAGETITLTAQGSATGNPWGGIGKPGGSLTYYYAIKANGDYESNSSTIYFKEDNPQDSLSITFTIPEKGNFNGKYKITANAARCGPCEVTWIYEAEVGDPLGNGETEEDKCEGGAPPLLPGIWKTTFGEMDLSFDGLGMKGTFGDSGTINGRFIMMADDFFVFKGEWTEKSRFGGVNKGTFTFTPRGCEEFEGRWENEDGSRGWVPIWNGVRIGEKVSEKPEKDDKTAECEEKKHRGTEALNPNFLEMGFPPGTVAFVAKNIGGEYVSCTGETLSIEERMPIYLDDCIKTGFVGGVKLTIINQRFAEGYSYDDLTLSVGTRSEICFKESGISNTKRSLFEVLKGGVRALVNARDEGSSFEIKAGKSVSIVDGSEVMITYNPDSEKAGAYVIDGHMVVSNIETVELTSLTNNQKLVVENGNIGEIQALSQAEWDSLVEENGLNLGEDESTATPDTILDSNGVPTLDAEDTDESRGISKTIVLFLVIILVIIAFVILLIKKMIRGAMKIVVLLFVILLIAVGAMLFSGGEKAQPTPEPLTKTSPPITQALQTTSPPTTLPAAAPPTTIPETTQPPETSSPTTIMQITTTLPPTTTTTTPTTSTTTTTTASTTTTTQPKPTLELVDETIIDNVEDKFWLGGKVRNNGDSEALSVKVRITLYNDMHAALQTLNSVPIDRIGPGETIEFNTIKSDKVKTAVARYEVTIHTGE